MAVSQRKAFSSAFLTTFNSYTNTPVLICADHLDLDSGDSYYNQDVHIKLFFVVGSSLQEELSIDVFQNSDERDMRC